MCGNRGWEALGRGGGGRRVLLVGVWKKRFLEEEEEVEDKMDNITFNKY